ncbi:MAG TPA: Fic family protein [Solirubrobacterales bacterium]|nr:Fic family protein [Solirubrobacterales bacterium]
MDPRFFTADAWGEITEAPDGYPAFVPKSAPRSLILSGDALGALDEASNRLGVLQGIGRQLRNPHLLISPYLRREAVLSSRIEGTQTTMSDVYAAELDQQELIRAPDVQEVQNYIAAHQLGLSTNLPLSLRLIRNLHRRLMQGVRGRERHPGKFRTYQNFIGATKGEDATYVPPPLPEMNALLNDLEGFLHEQALRPLVQAAVIHYQFEAIHPFGDGNGRVGRLLIPLFLRDRGLLPQPLLYLSAYFERSRADYYENLMRVSTHGDWDNWIRYFLHGVFTQAKEAADTADQLVALHSRYRGELQAKHVTANVLALLDALFENPLVYTRRVEGLLGVSAPTARATIKTLEDHGILRVITARNWRRIYQADAIYALLRGE